MREGREVTASSLSRDCSTVDRRQSTMLPGRAREVLFGPTRPDRELIRDVAVQRDSPHPLSYDYKQ